MLTVGVGEKSRDAQLGVFTSGRGENVKGVLGAWHLKVDDSVV
jgi:hypothetical protein